MQTVSKMLADERDRQAATRADAQQNQQRVREAQERNEKLNAADKGVEDAFEQLAKDGQGRLIFYCPGARSGIPPLALPFRPPTEAERQKALRDRYWEMVQKK